MADMTDTPTDTAPAADRPSRPDTRMSANLLRYIPPVAALGTAFVLQVIAMTDTVGSALSGQYGQWAYAPAVLLGLSVASCAEGGAAYLMDLYDKHLIAGDSVWMLRLTMLAYVTASAGVIHWWTAERGLPAIISWVLAGMSASALYLWSRGARWRRRDVMRQAGLIDSAMPRFTMAAKLFHPVRWIQTVRLISWDPVRTTGEARERYDAWKQAKTARRTGQQGDSPPAAAPAPVRRGPVTQPPAIRPPAAADNGNVVAMSGRRRGGEPTIGELADTLGVHHCGRTVGKPTAQATLKRVYGSCSNTRAIKAKDMHNARVGGQRETADDSEREPAEAMA